MSEPPDVMTSATGPQRLPAQPNGPERRHRQLGLALVLLTAAFGLPLYQLFRFALGSALYSYVVLVPFISLCLIWLRRGTPLPASLPDRRLAILPLLGGGALLAIRLAGEPDPEDALALVILAFALLLISACACFLGRRTMRALAFPLGFLVFMAPLPTALSTWMETQLQQASASAAYGLFRAGGATVFRQENLFQLPGINLFVAPECSGIHSTIALFITSLLAGYLFLHSPWRRTVLVCAILPLSILRNGVRIYVIGELCVHYGPQMIDSYIHRHGGPIFFVLSLAPLLLLLWLLKRAESPAPGAAT